MQIRQATDSIADITTRFFLLGITAVIPSSVNADEEDESENESEFLLPKEDCIKVIKSQLVNTSQEKLEQLYLKNQKLQEDIWNNDKKILNLLLVHDKSLITESNTFNSNSGKLLEVVSRLIPSCKGNLKQCSKTETQIVKDYLFDSNEIANSVSQFIKIGQAYIENIKEKELKEKHITLNNLITKKKMIQEAKQKEYKLFTKSDSETQNKLSSKAYTQVTKALLIGGVASSSRPYMSKVEDMPSQELQQAVDSLKKKHKPKFPELKARYKSILRTQKDRPVPLRTIYSGVDNVWRGALYSQIRTKKYLDRVGMKEAILKKIRLELSDMHQSDLCILLQKAETNFRHTLKNLSCAKKVMSNNVYGLANAFLKTPLSIHDTKMMSHDMELYEFMQIIALIEMSKVLKGLKGNEFSIAEYNKIMAILNVAIMNKLEMQKEDSMDEMYFKHMTNEKIGKTLVAHTGKNALHRSLLAIGINIDKLPGFPLPHAWDSQKICTGYFEWSSKASVKDNDVCALIGRDSETLYDIDLNNTMLKQTMNQIKNWVNSSSETKTLVVDVTIPMSIKNTIDPILQAALDLRVELNGKFDILIVCSEQKQQSLGLGKFSAGASFLITNNEERRKKFDQEASKQRTMDQRLATFYREHVSENVAELVKEQSENAKKFAKDTKVIANGPFAFYFNELGENKFLEQHKGYSFGFVIKNWSSWIPGEKRVDPGLDEPRELSSKKKRSYF